MKLKKCISMTMVLFLLAASLTSCGRTEVIEVSVPDPTSIQGRPSVKISRQERADIPEADIETLLQAGIEATIEERDLWAISKITDTKVLMQLARSRSNRGRPEGEHGEGQETMTPLPEDTKLQHDAEKPERRSGNPPGNGIMPEGGLRQREGAGREPGNFGGRSAALAIVISGAEGSTLAEEDIFTQIQLAAEELGYQANRMEITEELQSGIEVPYGHSVKLVVLVNTQMPVELGEAVD